MRVDLPNVTLPLDSEPVWNYMDLQKFLNLVRTSALFFCRVDKLNDPNEGRVPGATVRAWKQRIEDGYYAENGHQLTDEDLTIYLKDLHRLRKQFLVDCWHLSDRESPAMWKMYAENRYGVALCSTIGRLKDAFEELPEKVSIGQVNYIEPDDCELDIQYTHFPVYNKLKYYAYEQELRIMIRDDLYGSPLQNSVGKRVRVDLHKLIERVYIAPAASAELQEVVSLYLRHHEYDIPVEHSSIEDLSFS